MWSSSQSHFLTVKKILTPVAALDTVHMGATPLVQMYNVADLPPDQRRLEVIKTHVQALIGQNFSESANYVRRLREISKHYSAMYM